MQLETLAYAHAETLPETTQRTYDSRDLEYLSSSELYGIPSNPFGAPSPGPLGIPGPRSFRLPSPLPAPKPIELPKFESIKLPSSLSLDYDRLSLIGSKKGYKIFDSNNGGAPLMRLDFDSHHGLPKNHLQHGEHDYFGRSGKEALEIFTEMYLKNKNIKFPWEE